ncbi:NAD-dependent epimerase/dehydratase family protein, partial [Salmonella sp. SAL4360]|uniref:NAD-dependent epimerase/dehydratase family protein n=1 Tax=Salmonella sp. SAL4360 TaxID=3159881 RepID=UPI00397C147B
MVFYGTGDETRDWLHVKDAAALLVVAAAHASVDCSVANGGTGHATSIRLILESLCDILGSELPSFSGISKIGDPQC